MVKNLAFIGVLAALAAPAVAAPYGSGTWWSHSGKADKPETSSNAPSKQTIGLAEVCSWLQNEHPDLYTALCSGASSAAPVEPEVHTATTVVPVPSASAAQPTSTASPGDEEDCDDEDDVDDLEDCDENDIAQDTTTEEDEDCLEEDATTGSLQPSASAPSNVTSAVPTESPAVEAGSSSASASAPVASPSGPSVLIADQSNMKWGDNFTSTDSIFISEGPNKDDIAGNSDRAKALLAQHNKVRAQFGAGPLTWNVTSAERASVDTSTSGCKMQHRGADNLYWSWTSDSEANFAADDAATSWANEYSLYKTEDPSNSKSGHFTAMVWKKTTSVGCGWYLGCSKPGQSREILVSCVYHDAPNVLGNYPENVGSFGDKA